jgi:uncharacterized coiled-coil protein SlyX
MIGAERFNAPKTALVSAAGAAAEDSAAAAAKSEERLAELELLRQYLEEAAEAVDKAVASTSTAVERMRKLLTSPDKKAMIIEMAEANEIDVPLMDLLQQNIDGAKAANQPDAAAFMEKVGVGRRAAACLAVLGWCAGVLPLSEAMGRVCWLGPANTSMRMRLHGRKDAG